MIVRADRRRPARGLARAALVPAAALLVHQLRFMLAFRGAASAELARQGHSYLHSLVPWIMLLIAVAVGGFLWALGRAARGQRSIGRYTLSLLTLWLFCSAALIAIFSCQEFLEGLFATGHPAGVAGIFGYGGWWAVPASLCVGFVLAAIMHGARWVLDEVTQRRCRPPRTASQRPQRLSVRREAWPLRLSPLAGGWSGRGPPG